MPPLFHWLQKEGGDSFKKSWQSLLAGIEEKSKQLVGVAVGRPDISRPEISRPDISRL